MPSTQPMTTTLLCALLYACSPGTGGELVDVQLAWVAEGQGKRPPGEFHTRTGFDVTLTKALVAVQSILVYAPRDEPLSLSRLFVGRALAHGGYDPFNGRIVRMEYSEPLELDLLARGAQSLGAVLAEAGPMGSATVVYADRVAGETGQAVVRGTASRDGEDIPFEGTLHLEDEPLLRRVDGVEARGELVRDGEIRLSVRPHVLLDEAHFDRLESPAKGARRVTSNTQVHTAWVFGARSTQTFSTEWHEP